MKFENLSIIDSPMRKILTSSDYNYIFDKIDGKFMRYGKTLEDDPEYAPCCEILDIELSTICHGTGAPCAWCYKSNTPTGKNMTLETYRNILNKIPPILTQVAFGIGDIDANPDLENIIAYTRSKGIIPNITINGFRATEDHMEMLAKNCGAVAVSCYGNGNYCFTAIDRLTSMVGELTRYGENPTLRQINIHKLLATETVDECKALLDTIHTRKIPVNAVVFLLLKPKGTRNTLTTIKDVSVYKDLIGLATKLGIQVGMDSCSAPLVLKSGAVSKEQIPSVEPCESFGLFSAYIDVNGKYFPCSFAPGTDGWKEGMDVAGDACTSFAADIWESPKVKLWREKSLSVSSKCNCEYRKLCRPCPLFDITPCLEK